MLSKALKGKIHRATVTGTKIDYPGSVGIDADLLEAANIKPYEEVLLANVTNGERLGTYCIPAPAGSGEFTVLGAAARHFSVGDIVIVMNFAYYTDEEMDSLKPSVVVPDENNKIAKIL
ncbi:Aspartate 1-decarboxylase precursor [Anaerohalosphaera lusitana]|uniref:Aspartate 1-decarboxylase n=1 Tax=Anaerohalosphaera lusitana TaxID=1936003 RepID=A0A1U9NM73_9BACT|nr:aspartate 1-decarboxylase [Anaerohalosphaera lusitana]AQT69009.1 Aspartate 1-decarboxylase precursor [Anaerohalosphaera lusitana]